MTARTTRRDTRRFRLATNDNEIVVGVTRPTPFPQVTRPTPFPQSTGGDDVEGHGLAGGDAELTSVTRPTPFPQAGGDTDDADAR